MKGKNILIYCKKVITFKIAKAIHSINWND